MRLGIFAKTFERPSVEEVLEAVRGHGLDCVQFNMSCAGLPSLPDTIDSGVITRIHSAAQASGVRIAALSGTFNMIHPDTQTRANGLARLRTQAGCCQGIGASVVTLCTGTRDPINMWHRHPENDSLEAWADLLRSIETALSIAEEANVILAFEPEHANVINSAARGRALLDEMQSKRLRIIMDGANLIEPGGDQKRILDEAFDLLGEEIIIAHAKDRTADGGFCAAGMGILDYEYYLRLLQTHSSNAPLILHGLNENQVDSCLHFLQHKLGQG